jgi:hypothetical protein
MLPSPPRKWRLAIRVCLTAIFAAAAALGFAFGRPAFAVVMVAFLLASVILLARLASSEN